MNGPYGCWNKDGIDGLRKKFPVYRDEHGHEAAIPFSSDIKFNLMVRNMEAEGGNLCVFLKGAPERVVVRCATILMDGKDVKLTKDIHFAINSANDRFGGMGERVLAFARLNLSPEIFTNKYVFDVQGWKKWKDVREFDSHIKGWFPMWNLQLVGLVSLNDPPRPSVDISVLKCRNAGIKVIMVTGDQPPTAAAIAHKVNIITNPDLEYNNILKKNPSMSEADAFEMCNAIVIHGDELARVHGEEEALDENEIEKGRKIMDWIRKPEVVFARTTPSQKLLIVDAC
jgi:sodium/potassium-transporting ATPase subunit alpha